MENIVNLLTKPVKDLDGRVKESLVKFLKFVPQLIKHGNYSKYYDKHNLSNDINNYEISDASSFKFEFNCCTDDVRKIDRQQYHQILQRSNFLNILCCCFKMLFVYVEYSIEHVDETDYEFLTTVIKLLIRTYGILMNNSDWLKIIQISKTVEKFLEFLLEILSSLGETRLKEKHGVYLLNMKLLILFKKDADCRNIIIDFIDKKLSRYLYDCQKQTEHHSVILEDVINMLIVLKIMLQCKFNPKEEILRTVIMNLDDRPSNGSASNSNRNCLSEMLHILRKYVPKYVQSLLEDCVYTMQLK